jgi:hypothetical protein
MVGKWSKNDKKMFLKKSIRKMAEFGRIRAGERGFFL